MVQFLKNYINLQGVETPVVICSRIALTWLHKLGYLHKNVRKDVFVDGHERSDVVEDHANFLRQTEELKPYMVEFYDNGAMKHKVYLSDCAVESEIRQPIIVITHNECIFSANDGVQKAWIRKEIHFYDQKNEDKALWF